MNKLIECTSKTGLVIGLIDTIINASHVLVSQFKKELCHPSTAIMEALKDLSETEDLYWILKCLESSVEIRNLRVNTEEDIETIALMRKSISQILQEHDNSNRL